MAKPKFTTDEEQLILDWAWQFLRSWAVHDPTIKEMRHGPIEKHFSPTPGREKLELARSIINKTAGK